MSDRGMIKWQPFSAVTPSNKMVNDVLKEKSKVKMPDLSEEQIMEMEKLVVESYTNGENILLTIFHNGYIFKKKSIVSNINTITSKITFCDGSFIYFRQILNIKKR
ncbi:MAG: YolD-like family protein [Bacilli bacterium]